MREFTIRKNDAGQRMDRFLAKACPSLPGSLAQKFLRRKRCKVNGKAAARDGIRVQERCALCVPQR